MMARETTVKRGCGISNVLGTKVGIIAELLKPSSRIGFVIPDPSNMLGGMSENNGEGQANIAASLVRIGDAPEATKNARKAAAGNHPELPKEGGGVTVDETCYMRWL